MVQVWEGVLIIAILIGVGFRLIPRAKIPAHLSGHQVHAEEDLLSRDVRKKLMDNIRQMKTFESNVDTAKSTGIIPTYEHIGEAIPISADGTCAHHFLFPNADRTRCILPERVDIGKHYVLTGGLDGMKEPFNDLINRVSSFARYTFLNDLDKYPVVKNLFESDNFQDAAKSVCPADKNYLDPFQFTFIINVPGQTVAAHLDAPYFWGANRFRFPQWLLVSMVFSGLFQDKFIDQIQVVGYLHEWRKDINPREGGDFVYYANSSYVGKVESKPGSGTIVDGSKVVHAAKVFKPTVKAPYLDKDKVSQLVYTGADKWELLVDNQVIRKYETSDLRISMVYRARCFHDRAEAEKYQYLPEDQMMTLDSILDTLKADMVAKKAAVSLDALNNMPKLNLAFLIIDTYVKYPLPPRNVAWIPYNYCALPRIAPWTASFLSYICK